jgi:hypothetical protein
VARIGQNAQLKSISSKRSNHMAGIDIAEVVANYVLANNAVYATIKKVSIDQE